MREGCAPNGPKNFFQNFDLRQLQKACSSAEPVQERCQLNRVPQLVDLIALGIKGVVKATDMRARGA